MSLPLTVTQIITNQDGNSFVTDLIASGAYAGFNVRYIGETVLTGVGTTLKREGIVNVYDARYPDPLYSYQLIRF